MLGSVARNSLDPTVVHLQRDVESNHRLAALYEFKHVARDVSLLCSSCHKQLHLVQKSWFTIFIKIFVA